MNPSGGENSGGPLEVEVEAEAGADPGCAATLRVADAVLRVQVAAVVVGVAYGERSGGKRSAAAAMAPPRGAGGAELDGR